MQINPLIMFQKNTPAEREYGAHEPETVIAASVKVEGDFQSQGNVLIEGVVEGSLKTERDLRVGERARIAADVFAANATIAGEIRGNLTVTERLELESTARIHGDVRTKVLVVASGATMNGRLVMGDEVIMPDDRKLRAAKTVAAANAVAQTEEEEEKALAPFLTRG